MLPPLPPPPSFVFARVLLRKTRALEAIIQFEITRAYNAINVALLESYIINFSTEIFNDIFTLRFSGISTLVFREHVAAIFLARDEKNDKKEMGKAIKRRDENKTTITTWR